MSGAVIFALMSLYMDADPEQRYQIDAIRFEQVSRTSEPLLEATTLLKTGETYTQTQISEAVNRVRRLPFIMHAAFRLESGSEAGTHRLVIEVREQRGIHLDATTQYLQFNDNDSDSFDQAVVGGQLFFGDAHQFRATVKPGVRWTSDFEPDTEYGLGYSNYNLFGQSIRLHLDLRYTDREDVVTPFFLQPDLQITDYDDDVLIPSLRIEAPVFGSHEIRLFASQTRRDVSLISGQDDPNQPTVVFTGLDNDREHVSLGWYFDTTDDEFAPRRGVAWNVTYGHTQSKDFNATFNTSGAFLYYLTENKTNQLALSYRQYLSSMGPHTFYVGGAAEWLGRSRDPLTVLVGNASFPIGLDGTDDYRAEVGGGYGYDLLTGERFSRLGDFRFDIGADLGRLESRYNDGFGSSSRYDYFHLNSSLSFRTDWGKFKLGFTWREGL